MIKATLDGSVFQLKIKALIDGFEKAFEDGLRQAAYAGAERARNVTYYTPRSGRLQQSTYAVEHSALEKGIIANTFYASWVNFGNGPPGARIYPIRAKALKFYINNELMFRKSVKTSRPMPFMTNTVTWLEEGNFEAIVTRSIWNFIERTTR